MCRYSPTLRGSGSRRLPQDTTAMRYFSSNRLRAATLVAPVLALLTIAQTATAQANNQASSASAMAQGQAAAIAKARADSARYPYTTADVNFMSGMIHHHAQ